MHQDDGKSIALVLGAGGARGLAHIGVIEELLARGYRIEAVVGCSMGALVGGIYCAGRLPEYRKWACSLTRREVFHLVDFAFGHPGFIKGDRVIGVLRQLVGEHRIEELPVAYKAVATNLDSRCKVWLDHGPLFDAIRASIAIPMLLTPYHHQGQDLVDGGLLAPLPVSGARDYVGLRVVAVDINAPNSGASVPVAAASGALAAASAEAGTLGAIEMGWARLLQSVGRGGPAASNVKANRSVMELMSRSLSTMHGYMTEMQLERDPPDVLIGIAHDACAIYEFWRADEMIELGRQAAARALDQSATGI
ncbi:patatin-like phospholipase family protein [Arenimonas sp.]|jgi:NTE family protein|uniref:patatin-like phospholipase family protein n=1 Tax=Arenimonas sp. TaxID=1872635 RepID=UPI0037C06868